MTLVFLTIIIAWTQACGLDVHVTLKRLANRDEEVRITAAEHLVEHARNPTMPVRVGKVMLVHDDVKIRRKAVDFFNSRDEFDPVVIGWLADACLKEKDLAVSGQILDLLERKGRGIAVLSIAQRLKNCEGQTRRRQFVSFLRNMALQGYDFNDHVENLESALEKSDDGLEREIVAKAILSTMKRTEKQTNAAAGVLWKIYLKEDRRQRVILSQYFVHLDEVKPRVTKDLIDVIEKEPIKSDTFLDAVRSASYTKEQKKEFSVALEERLKKEMANSQQIQPVLPIVALVCLYLNPNSRIAKAVLDQEWDDLRRTFDQPTDKRYVELTLDVLVHFQSQKSFPRSQVEMLASAPHVPPTIQSKAKELLKKLKK